MALNITVIGNSYYNDEKVDCYYQVHYYPAMVSSPIYATEDQTFSFNIGGADHLGKDGEFKKDHICLVNLWLGESDKSEMTSQTVLRIKHDGESHLYDSDINLKNIFDTQVSLELNEVYELGDKVEPIVNINSTFQWLYNEIYLYQRPSWYGFILNPNTGTDAMSINFDYELGLTSDYFYIYKDIGVKEVLLKVIDGMNREYLDSKSLEVKHKQPIIDISYSPKAPDIDDDIEVSVSITSQTSYSYNLYIDDYLVSNHSKSISTNIGKLQLDSYSIKVELTYNDGFQTKLVTSTLPIFMRNMPPEVSIIEVEKNPPILSLGSDIVNRDDDIASIDWYIYKLVKDKSSNIVTKVRLDKVSSKDLYYNFNEYGDIIIELEVIDIHGAIGKAIYNLHIDCASVGAVFVQDVEFIQEGVIVQDFSQKIIVNNYDFSAELVVPKFRGATVYKEVFKEVIKDSAFNVYKVEEI